VVTTVADPFAGEVACGIEQTANDHGYAVFLANSNADAECERKMVQALAERRVDGIIVTSSRVGSDYLPMLAELNVPMVLVNDQYPGEFVHSVMIANEDGSRAATEHLIELGHRRIGYVGTRPKRSGWKVTSRHWRRRGSNSPASLRCTATDGPRLR
jgi:DNA-binding LacI/PurR family transcriptional regulator